MVNGSEQGNERGNIVRHAKQKIGISNNARRKGFTLIELLIVVAIIAILAAIAVPNFLEAQTRAKVARVKADMRALATAIETYRVDHNEYPEGTDDPTKYPLGIAEFLGPLAPGYYTFRTRGPGGQTVGRDFAALTTPIAYIHDVLTDPFAAHVSGIFTYCYRNAKDRKNGWILTSVGPDADLIRPGGVGTDNANPISTVSDPKVPARLGDINERIVVAVMEGNSGLPAAQASMTQLVEHLKDLEYDPTNGTISDGDIWRFGP